MLTHRWALVAALGVTLGALTPAAGQERLAGSAAMPRLPGTQPAVEAFYSRIAFDGRGGVRAHGLGGRALWHLPPTDAAGLAARSAFGVYGVYTPEQGLGFSTTNVGLSAEVSPLAHPLTGRVEPLVSLDAGALRTVVQPGGPTVGGATPLADRSNVGLALTPGAGLRLHVAPGLALRGDVRDVVTFRGGVRHNAAIGAGVHLAR